MQNEKIKLGTYSIYHAVNPTFTEDDNQERAFVADIFASNLDDAYVRSQNFFNAWNKEKPCRSTSVGDVIRDPHEVDYLVLNFGFKVLNSAPTTDKVIIKDAYGSYIEAIEHMMSQNVVHLGWLNAGVVVPKHLHCEIVYKNYSGSSCLYVDPIQRVAYSVDMSD